jgi:hypothetical protein
MRRCAALIGATVGVLVSFGGCVGVYSENSRLRAKVHDLEQEIAPFRNLAVQEFRNADASSLKKLADLMATLRADYSTQLTTVNALRAEIAGLRPKPLPEQLLALLKEIDPAIRSHLSAGRNVDISGYIKQSQKDTLDKLFADPGCSKYITPVEHGESFAQGDAGPTAYVRFVVLTNLLDAH